jgi:Domain of unknown function (DUF5666)
MNNMRRIRKSSMVLPAAIAALALLPGAGPATAKSSSAGLTNFHGTVSAVSSTSASRTLKLKRASGTTLTFRITASTEFERLSGLSALTKGKSIEVKARRVDGRWVARQIEPSTGSDDDGGGSGGGGSDDAAGDDHGSGGHGSDD